jgi:hypothetical protein
LAKGVDEGGCQKAAKGYGVLAKRPVSRFCVLPLTVLLIESIVKAANDFNVQL